MSTTEQLNALANSFAQEGNHYAAAILHFVAAIHATGDRHAMAILSTFAMKVSEQACRRADRVSEEHEAVAELVREL